MQKKILQNYIKLNCWRVFFSLNKQTLLYKKMRLREFLNEIEKYKCLKLNIQFEKIIIITTTIIYQTHVLHLKGTKKTLDSRE